MKKYLFVTLILIISFFTAGAQQFGGGIMAGLAASQVAGDKISGFKKAGVFAGGFVNLQISPHSAFQMELEYFQKGARENPTEKNNYYSHIFRASYVELPVLYQYIFNDRVKAEVGPSMGVLIGYYEETNEEILSDKYGYNKPATLTFQINLGLYVMLSEKFAINFRTNNSLFNIRSKNVTGDVWRFWSYGQFHDSLLLSLYYTFKKKK